MPIERRSLLLLLALTALGFGLRLYRLDYQSVWNDEGVSLSLAPLPVSTLTMAEAKASYDSNPPLYLYLLHGFLKLFGFGTFQARLLSLIFGVLAIPMIYLLGAELFDSAAGLFSAGLLSVSELAVAYSQEVRNYELALFLTLLTTWFFVRAIREGRDTLAWAGFVLGTVLLAYTHYYAVFIPATLVGFAIIRYRRYPIPGAWWVSGAVVSCVLYLPWLMVGLRGALGFQHEGPQEEAASTKAQWWSLISGLNFYHNGKWSGLNASTAWWVFAAGYVLFTLPAAFAYLTAKRDRTGGMSRLGPRDAMLILALLTAVPILLIVLAASHTGSYNYRYIVFCAGPYYVLAAYGLSRIPSASLRWITVLLIGVFSAAGLHAIYSIPSKEDNRDAVLYVRAHLDPADSAVFVPRNRGREHNYWRIYNPGVAWPSDVDFDQIAARPDGFPRVWIVWDRTWWKNPRGKAASLVEALQHLENTHTVTDRRQFFGAEIILYTRKPSY